MMNVVDYVAALVRLNGGRIVGKTRLQKTVFLMEAKGGGIGFDFDYHNYGPFSSDVAFAADDAEALGYIETETDFGAHEVPYTIFTSTDAPPTFDDEATEIRRSALEVMGRYSALVLELAATAKYLEDHGYPESSWQELESRKPLKASSERIEKAKNLLMELLSSR